MLQTKKHLEIALRKKNRVGFFHYTAIKYNNKCIFFGGTDSKFNFYNHVYEYNFLTHEFTKVSVTGAIPFKNANYSAVLYKDKMYLFTASIRHLSLADEWFGNFYELDLKSYLFRDIEIIERFMEERYQHSAVVFKDYMYVFGGCVDVLLDYKGCHGFDVPCGGCMMSYHFPSNKWSRVHVRGDVPKSRSGHSATLYHDYMYIFGGYEKSIRFPGLIYYQDLYRFNLDTHIWESITCYGHIPSGRRVHSACMFQDWMFVMGGETRNGYSNEVFVLDLKSRSWKKFCDLPHAKSCHSTVVYNLCLYTLGGHTGAGCNQVDELYFGELLGYFTMNKIMKSTKFADVIFELHESSSKRKRKRDDDFENVKKLKM